MVVAIKNRLKEIPRTNLGEYQHGFRENSSDQAFILKQVIHNSIDQNLQSIWCLLILNRQYDKIKSDTLIKTLGIKAKLIRLIKMSLIKMEYQVSIKGQTSEQFKVSRDVRQCDPLSTTLFNTILDAAVKQSEIPTKGATYNHRN